MGEGKEFLDAAKKEITIDRGLMMEMIGVLETTTPQEGFGMLCLGLSFLFRSGTINITMHEFLAAMLKQVRTLVEDPPEGFRDGDIEFGEPDPRVPPGFRDIARLAPSPDCNCPACTLARTILKEIKARAH